MSQDKRSAREQQKHISMDLTADGARVTNLSLQGSRLVLTIEADLAESRLRTDDARDDTLASVPPPPPAPRHEPAPESAGFDAFAKRPKSADAASLGLASPEDAAPESLAMGSENLPPAPSAAFRNDDAESMAVPPDDIAEPDAFHEDADFILHSDPHDRRHSHEHDHDHDHAHDHAHDAAHGAAHDAPAGTPARTGSDADDTLPEPKGGFDPFAQDDFLPASPGGDADSLALSEDSSAVGGERHGEPLPAFSFGSASAAPEPQPPAPEPEPEPAAQPFAPASQGKAAAEDVPTQFAMRPPAPEPEAKPPERPAPPAPAPEPPAGDAPKQGDDPLKTDAGGTTVLIRYTCPKCKTQGMQAVDKVGTVVHCSNCGKAMRLVMKK